MKNISTLPMNALLSTSKPFFICEADKSLLPLTPEVTWQRTVLTSSLLGWGVGRFVYVRKEEDNVSPLSNFSPEKYNEKRMQKILNES